MPETEVIAPVELIINRTFEAPIEAVFRAWTNKAELDRWFAPADDYTVASSVDFRVGGAYRFDMRRPDGALFTATGKYVEINAPYRIVFTWTGACEIEPQETLVTVEFFSVGRSTQVTLTHRQLSTEDSRQRHEHGWIGCLSRLGNIL